MSIHPTPRGGYVVRWRDASGANRSKSFAKGEYRLAQAFDQEVKRAKRLGYLPQLESSKKTVGQVVEEWWAAHGSQKAPRTAELYEQLLVSHVLPHFDTARLGEVGVAQIEAWLAKLDTGPTAKRNALGVLGQVFNYAVRAGYIQGNPCALARKPKLPEREPVNPPTVEQVEEIRSKLLAKGRLGDATMVSVMAYAGLRTHEVRDLTWFAVRENTILARSSKTGRTRAVNILPPLAEDLAEWREACKGQSIVFPTATGKRFTKHTWDNWRKRIFQPVAPEGTTPYDLRHFYVSMMLRDPSYSRVYVAEQAGHSLEVQDKHYAHVIADGQTGSFVEAIRRARGQVFGKEAANVEQAAAPAGGREV